jgi:hypothetical protein
MLGVVLGLAGVLIGIYGIWRTRPARPVVQTRTHVVAGRAEGIRERTLVQFDGKPVVRVSLTAFHFWNAGWGALRKEDVAEAIKFCVPEDWELVDAWVEHQSRTGSAVSVETDQRCIVCDFHHINFREGAVVGALATGGPLMMPLAFGDVVNVRGGVKVNPSFYLAGFGSSARARREALLSGLGFLIMLTAAVNSFLGPADVPLLLDLPRPIAQVAFPIGAVVQLPAVYAAAQGLGWFVPRGLRRAGEQLARSMTLGA